MLFRSNDTATTEIYTLSLHGALPISLALAVVATVIARTINIAAIEGASTNIRGVWQSFHHALKRLLISDIIIRTCEGLADFFIVLFVINVRGLSPARYGALVAIQMVSSMLVTSPLRQDQQSVVQHG